MNKERLREELAELEHEQWVEWSKSLADKEVLNAERLQRWARLWRPYSELTEEEKDQDRVYADKVLAKLDLLKKELLAKVELRKEDCRAETGSFKYDDIYDDIIEVVKETL